MDYKQLFFILALGFLIPSLITPWASIDFIDEKEEYTPIKITRYLMHNEQDSPFNLVNMIKPYKISHYSMILGMILYFSSFYFLWQSNTKKSNKLLIIGIFLLSLSILFYTISIENYKTEFSKIANETGGIIGEEFKGDEKEIINNILRKEPGYNLAIIAGIISILSFIWKKEN